MNNDTLSFFLTLLALGVLILGVSFGRKKGLPAELSRKIVHIFMGLICMSFPWVFQHVLSVQILGAVAILSLCLLRSKRLKGTAGSALFSVERVSIGELLFPLAVAWLFTLGKETPILYLISLLMLTFADAFGALVGTRYGRRHYETLSGKKTIEGSLTFFLVAFLCCFLPLKLTSDASLTTLLLISLTVSLIATYTEGLASHGLDNLLIPITVFLTLDYYLVQSEGSIWMRVIALVILSVLVVSTLRIQTFDGAGMIGCILVGYGAFTLGGVPCLLASLILFLRHIYTTRKYGLKAVVTHSIDTLLWVTAVPLTWLTLGRTGAVPYEIAQVTFIFSLAAVTGMLVARTCHFLEQSTTSLWKAPVWSLLTLLPAFFISHTLSVTILLIIITVFFSFIAYWVVGLLKTEKASWVSLFLLSVLHSGILLLIF